MLWLEYEQVKKWEGFLNARDSECEPCSGAPWSLRPHQTGCGTLPNMAFFPHCSLLLKKAECKTFMTYLTSPNPICKVTFPLMVASLQPG